MKNFRLQAGCLAHGLCDLGQYLQRQVPHSACDPLHLAIEPAGFFRTLDDMSKLRNPATGEGYLGEIMVHKISRAVGIVDNVAEAKDGWPPQITLKLKDGSLKKGKLSDFREPHAAEREQITAA